jgi:hypothetical protein
MGELFNSLLATQQGEALAKDDGNTSAMFEG